MLMLSFHLLLRRGARTASMRRLAPAGKGCHKVLKAFVSYKSVQIAKSPELPGKGFVALILLCNHLASFTAATELRLENWIPEFSPGDAEGTAVSSFRAAVMMLSCCPELAVL